jgi:hypothetical protein
MKEKQIIAIVILIAITILILAASSLKKDQCKYELVCEQSN